MSDLELGIRLSVRRRRLGVHTFANFNNMLARDREQWPGIRLSRNVIRQRITEPYRNALFNSAASLDESYELLVTLMFSRNSGSEFKLCVKT